MWAITASQQTMAHSISNNLVNPFQSYFFGMMMVQNPIPTPSYSKSKSIPAWENGGIHAKRYVNSQ
jgi:hypothetical protein